MIGLFAALVLFAQGAPASEPAAPADAPKSAAPAKAKDKGGMDKMVCHEEAEVGSHLTRTVCLSRRAENDKAQDDQQALQRLRDRSQAMPH